MKRSPLPRTNPKRRARNFKLAYGSPERVQWVHACGCCVPSIHHKYRMEAVHVVSKQPQGQGGPDDVVPMCAWHHRQLHAMGKATFEGYHGINLTALAIHYAELWKIREGGVERMSELTNELQLIRSLMYAETLGDVHDAMDAYLQRAEKPALEGNFHDGWTDKDNLRYGWPE